MSDVVLSNYGALPRDIDVNVTISKPQIERVTDFSVVCFATTENTTDGDFGPGPSRIRYYNSLAAVQADFAASSEAVRAATDFFKQSPRAKTLAIGRIFTSATNGYLLGGTLANKTLAEWKAITTGSFKISIDGSEQTISSVSFASITKMDDIAGVIEDALQAVNSGGFTAATVTFRDNKLKVTSGTTGASSSVSRTSEAASGTYIGGFLGLDAGESIKIDGYVPGGLDGELELIRQASVSTGKFVYGWTLQKSYRDTADLIDAADWAEAQSAAILGVVTNNYDATDASVSTDIGSLFKAAGYRRSFVIYHDNAYYYPEVALLAYALHVDYRGINTTITTKFKDLFGIPTVPMDVTMLETLNGKNINTFTLVGQNSRTFRNGVQSNENWFIDDLINLDNFREYLQVSVYNVFLSNKKVPYNQSGVNLLRNAIVVVCDQFVKNGTLSERPSTPEEKADSGYDVQPAYSVSFKDIFEMTAEDRAKRIGPPASITANLTGAIHSLDINVEAYA